MPVVNRYIVSVFFMLRGAGLFAQDPRSINWMTFGEMEAAFAREPKMVFIDFWADWCGVCKRMDRYVFSKPEVMARLNEEFYAVKMDAETTDTIHFGGKQFVNHTVNDRRIGFHELAVLLGKNEDGQFSLPLMVIYDSRFQLVRRIDRYTHSKAFLEILIDAQGHLGK